MRLLFVLFIFMLGTVPQSSVPAEADEVLAPLSKIRLDKKQFYNIRDITIRRDALSIALNRGTIAFLEPVLGRVTGAVFIGSGEVVAIPPDAIEKQELYKFTGSPVLNGTFPRRNVSIHRQYLRGHHEAVLPARRRNGFRR